MILRHSEGLPNMKRAIVVAHPDDEVLWAGGLPLRFPGDWTVVCCSTPAKDPVRAEHFFDACDVLGVKGKIFPFLNQCLRTG